MMAVENGWLGNAQHGPRRSVSPDEAPMNPITSNPEIVSGAWVIAGTRIKASSVKAFWRAGYTINQIIAEYPTLTDGQVMAAVRFKQPRTAPRASHP